MQPDPQPQQRQRLWLQWRKIIKRHCWRLLYLYGTKLLQASGFCINSLLTIYDAFMIINETKEDNSLRTQIWNMVVNLLMQLHHSKICIVDYFKNLRICSLFWYFNHIRFKVIGFYCRSQDISEMQETHGSLVPIKIMLANLSPPETTTTMVTISIVLNNSKVNNQ